MKTWMIRAFIYTLFASILYSSLSFANPNEVAKVIILKGKVQAQYKDGSTKDVVIDQWLPEGAKLTTEEKSFVKLLFIDKSQMNLGPKSEMVITSFPKNEAGIINLVKGQLRSKVTKDYMQMDDKSKSKLYIKTKSAAMGIRGTDFQVNFNEINGNTALITFEGAVAMAGIEKEFRERSFNQEALEKFVSSEKAVLVKDGQFSAVTQITDRALVPALLAPTQLETLKVNESGIVEPKNDGEQNQNSEKSFKSPIPPGVDATSFSNDTKELDKQVEKTSDGKEITEKVSKDLQKEAPKTDGKAQGFYNAETGAMKFPAGSVVDLTTVNVIPPPANAQFDPNTQTFILPANFGKVDPSTGSYKAPSGLKLTNEGRFVVVETPKPATATTATSGTRTPASTATSALAPVMISIVPVFVPPTLAINITGTTSTSTTLLPPPTTIDTKLQDLATDTIQDITNTINQATETGVTNPNSRVRFIFNAQ